MKTTFMLALLFASTFSIQADDDVEVTPGQVTIQPDEYLMIPLRIERSSGNLLKFRKTQNAIQSMKDDLGNDLLGKEKVWRLIKNVEVSSSGKHINMEIQAVNFPAEDARKVTVEGVLTFLCTSGKQTHVEENIRVVTRSKGLIGGIPFQIRSIQPSSPDKIVQIFYDDLKRENSPVIRIDYLSNGEPIEGKANWRYTKGGYMVHVNMPVKTKTMDIKMLMWGDFEVIEVPYSFTVNL